jgi:hypothetical protein
MILRNLAEKDSIERESLDLLIDFIKNTEGIAYIPITRPESDTNEPGSYDFLCKKESAVDEWLAVEVVTFMEDQHRKAFDLAISPIAAEVVNRLDGKIPGDFELQIAGPPKNIRFKELVRQKDRLVDELEQSILEIAQDPIFLVGEQHMIQRPITCDLIKMNNHGHSLTILMDYYDSNMPKNFAHDNFKAYLSRSIEKIFRNKNKQLQIPKDAGKQTALLIIIDMDDPTASIYGSTKNLRQIIESQSRASWSNIDRIYVQRGKSIHLVSAP